MTEAVLNSFIHNNKIYNVSEFDNIYSEKFPSIYEVIRIIDKVPIFLEEHYERLKHSAEIIGYKLNLSIESIKENINKMIELNYVDNYNIKIVLNDFNLNLNEYYYFIKSTYPEPKMYKEGVKACLYHAVRENPNAKIINAELRNEINNILNKGKYYEAILVNNGEITEGSRSNIFFIKDDSLYTSPLSKVLPGITRQKILNLCQKNNINIYEYPIYANEIESYDAAFISGTSPKVLPISKINDISFNTQNKLLLKIMNLYDEEIKIYISKQK
ncbi:branched-chain amino acid aminotransferase [Caloramator quimbayensis]|uniref:Branched-chain amino acid aminotransferase n=1 Tax=Caloramator quimbayensis TaxID=1147123 RepID=A0A1T4X735_9CLOT|nr:aminotransferase class IV [Caloramator quimbayensis]SKA84865.1 branched-chain amino acid aminotransferase [Caloramator quimbayensis]